MSKHKWDFAPRFRRAAFGWRSALPRQRLKEALVEIKLVARTDPVLAAEGAILLLSKISAAFEQVDSSSGALGSDVNKAIGLLVPIIAGANVSPVLRRKWLGTLWEALQDDRIPYIELLGEFWDELCVMPEIASEWADEFMPIMQTVLSPSKEDHGFFPGTTACLSSLYGAKRYTELLALIENAPYQWWHYRRWGVKALMRMGKPSEALRFAEASRGLNDPASQIAQSCEEILLSEGLRDQAYRRYAIAANQGQTYLATFKAIAKKYPEKARASVLEDLIASTPGMEGKWFAAAKDAQCFDVALKVAASSPVEPRTLIRAARDFQIKRPDFAFAAAALAMHWIALGYGYEITGADVCDACDLLITAGQQGGRPPGDTLSKIQSFSEGSHSGFPSLRELLAQYLRA